MSLMTEQREAMLIYDRFPAPNTRKLLRAIVADNRLHPQLMGVSSAANGEATIQYAVATGSQLSTSEQNDIINLWRSFEDGREGADRAALLHDDGSISFGQVTVIDRLFDDPGPYTAVVATLYPSIAYVGLMRAYHESGRYNKILDGLTRGMTAEQVGAFIEDQPDFIARMHDLIDANNVGREPRLQ